MRRLLGGPEARYVRTHPPPHPTPAEKISLEPRKPLGGAVSPPKLLREVSDARAKKSPPFMPHPARALTKAAWVRAGKTSFDKTPCLSWHVGGEWRIQIGRAQETQGKDQAVVLGSQDAAPFLNHSRSREIPGVLSLEM